MTACALTGHRELDKDFTSEVLRKQLYDLVERGVTTFYCGMAIGFDLLCAREILEIKNISPYAWWRAFPAPIRPKNFPRTGGTSTT